MSLKRRQSIEQATYCDDKQIQSCIKQQNQAPPKLNSLMGQKLGGFWQPWEEQPQPPPPPPPPQQQQQQQQQAI